MIRVTLLLAASAFALASCALFEELAPESAPAPEVEESEVTEASAPPPPPAARTAEQFDTTTPEQRAAATAAPTRASSARLGTTVISLGPPAEPGLWLRTGLVSERMQGRVENPANGKSVAVELRPSGGGAGGAEISLAAMRLLEVPLTSLPEVVVYRD